MKFLRTADAFRTRRREGPHRFTQKQPPTFVSALRSVAAVETAKNQLWRDFRCGSIFDFFNTIGAKRTFASCQCRVSATSFRTHAVQQNQYFAQRLKPVFSV